MKTRAGLLSLILCAVFLTAACEKTTIGRIESNPTRYLDKQVGIVGRVTNSFGVPFVGGVYKVDDGTGEIWVVSQRSVPSKGARIGVKGRVQNGLTFSGRNYGLGMIEEGRQTK